jgi:hypothetical protein
MDLYLDVGISLGNMVGESFFVFDSQAEHTQRDCPAIREIRLVFPCKLELCCRFLQFTHILFQGRQVCKTLRPFCSYGLISRFQFLSVD